MTGPPVASESASTGLAAAMDDSSQSAIASSQSAENTLPSNVVHDPEQPPEIPEQEHEAAHEDEHASHAAVMVWLGILIDAIPESLVIGILVNQSNGSVSA